MTVFEKFDLTDKAAVITGGCGLLGIKHAEAVLEANGIPIILDIDENGIDKVTSGLFKKYGKKVPAFYVDITKKQDIEKVCKKIQDKFNAEILINNAASNPHIKAGYEEKPSVRFENFPEQDWERELAVGLKGAFFCSQVFGNRMAEKGVGVILNISSDLGIIAPDQRIYRKEELEDKLQPVKPVTYSVIKHAIIGLTKYLATYWADKGVRVNALCPGGVYNDQPDEFVQKLTNLIPLGRMADKDEYKAAVLFLISDASSFITGSTLVADGGRTTW